MPLSNAKKEYTYAEYLSWPEDEHWEILDGIAYSQVTPSPIHQQISINISSRLYNYLQDKDCKVFTAPFTVRLPLDAGQTNDKNNKNVVEPDITIVCDKNKLDNGGYNGAPTIIIEIVSKSSAKRDNIVKLNKYEQAGVSEYWIITPETEAIMRYTLNEQGYYNKPDMFILGEDELIKSSTFADLTLQLQDIFQVWT